MIRTLVAEDSTTTRELLVAILGSDPEIQVIGEASDGIAAIEMTKQLRPDVVTMDIRMPQLDGFEATRRIMVEAPTPIVIVSASVDARGVEVSMNALRAGALTVLPKPPGPSEPAFEEHARRFIDTIKSMSQVKVVRRWGRPRPEATPAVRTSVAPAGARPRLVAIAASTGGPAALARILADLPGDFPVPILVVQHIARGFMDGFATWLNTSSALPVKVAQNGERLEPRTVYLAPDDRQMGVASDRASIRVTHGASIKGFCPSATFLFDSVAQAFGASAVGLILTGMGDDGVEGLRRMRDAGARVIGQDEESSVVFGMPGAALAAGVVDAVLPLAAIPSRLLDLVTREEASS